MNGQDTHASQNRASADAPDTLVLVSGRRLHGHVTGISQGHIELEERTGDRLQVVRIPREQVAEVELAA